jgi:hypothetical protein
MIVRFLPEAKSELLDAIEYYETQLIGLGQRFWDEVDQHINWIAENSEIPQLRVGGYRRVNLRIFPYYVGLHRSGSSNLDLIHRTRSQSSRILDRPDLLRSMDAPPSTAPRISSSLAYTDSHIPPATSNRPDVHKTPAPNKRRPRQILFLL